MPLKILGSKGYLPNKQANLRSLTLTTSTTCSSPQDTDAERYPLTSFRKPRKFSWKCLKSPGDYQALRDLLRENFDILEDLTIEASDTASEDDVGASMEGKPSLELVLPHISDNSNRSFPPLRLLSISEFSLTVVNEMMTPVVDLNVLCSLAILNCTDTPRFLRGVLTSGQHLVLKQLELKFQDRINQGSETSSLIEFLQSFEGLEALYLMIDPCFPTEVYWDSIATHYGTLKRFAYHERGTALGDLYALYNLRPTFRDAALRWGNSPRAYPWLMLPRYGLNADSSPPEFETTDIRLHGVLAATTLDCLALCDSPAVLRKIFEPCAAQRTFKLLHVRRTGVEVPYVLLATIEEWIQLAVIEENSDYLDCFSQYEEYNLCMGLFHLLDWAFGPHGLPELQVLAFGDFCHDGRYRQRSLLFCRQPLRPSKITWRLAERNETAIFEGIDRPMEFLGACPKDVTMLNRIVYDNEDEEWPGWSTRKV